MKAIVSGALEERNAQIRTQLEQLAEPEFRQFTEKMLPGTGNILGVRLPLLWKTAKELAKGDWKTYLCSASDSSYEEIMLQGMTLGYARGELQEKREFLERFIPKIDSGRFVTVYLPKVLEAAQQVKQDDYYVNMA